MFGFSENVLPSVAATGLWRRVLSGPFSIVARREPRSYTIWRRKFNYNISSWTRVCPCIRPTTSLNTAKGDLKFIVFAFFVKDCIPRLVLTLTVFIMAVLTSCRSSVEFDWWNLLLMNGSRESRGQCVLLFCREFICGYELDFKTIITDW